MGAQEGGGDGSGSGGGGGGAEGSGGSVMGDSVENVADMMKEPPGPTREEMIMQMMEKAKFYTSLCLGTTAVLSAFAFMFLIPFVVDPAITTILANYEPEPVTCISVEHIYAEGLRNCSWSSCREGCTNAPIRCHQIKVNYTLIPFSDFGGRDLSTVEWSIGETQFFVNTEGCGYPPRVNCTEFAKKYGNDKLGTPFPCYYSRTYPETVVARYNWDDNLRHLILSLIIPNVLFGVSIGVLSYWYCPGCGRACNKVYAGKYPSKDDDEEMESSAVY